MKEETRAERAAYGLLLVYFLLEYLRPQDQLLPFLAPLRIPGIVQVVLALLWLGFCSKSILRELPIRFALAFVLVMAGSIVFATNTGWASARTQTVFLTLLAGTLPAAALLGRSERMFSFLKFWVVAQALLALAGLLNDGRGPGGFLLAEYDLALALCMAIPYPFFLQHAPGAGRLTRILYSGAIAAMVLGIVATRSRGGVAGLVVVLVAMWLWSKRQMRSSVLVVAVACAGIAAVVVSTQPDYFRDTAAVVDPEDSTRGETLEAWELGWEMFLDHPILGVGAGNYPWNVRAYRLRQSLFFSGELAPWEGEPFSLYFTVLAELGLVGAVLLVAIALSLNGRLTKLVRRVERSSRESSPAETLALAATAMRCSLVVFLVYAVFVSALYYPHLWYLIGFTVALERALDDVYSGPNVFLTKPELIFERDLPPVSA